MITRSDIQGSAVGPAMNPIGISEIIRGWYRKRTPFREDDCFAPNRAEECTRWRTACVNSAWFYSIMLRSVLTGCLSFRDSRQISSPD